MTALVGVLCDRCNVPFLAVAWPSICPDCKCVNPCGSEVSGA